MLQNPFYKRMQGEAEAVLERHLKKAHHLRHFNGVGGQYVRALNLDPKLRPIPGRKDLTVQGFDPTGAQGLSVLYGSPQIFRAARIQNFVNFALALIQGKRRLPGAARCTTTTKLLFSLLVLPELDTSAGLLPMRKTEEQPGPMEVRRVKQGRKRNQGKCRTPTEHALEPRKTSKPKGQRRRKDVPRLKTRRGTPAPSEISSTTERILEH